MTQGIRTICCVSPFLWAVVVGTGQLVTRMGVLPPGQYSVIAIVPTEEARLDAGSLFCFKTVHCWLKIFNVPYFARSPSCLGRGYGRGRSAFGRYDSFLAALYREGGIMVIRGTGPSLRCALRVGRPRLCSAKYM